MKNKLPQIKKSINDFLTEEEGSVNKKNAINLAMTAVILGTIFYGSCAEAHNSYLMNDLEGGKHVSGPGEHDVPSHTSYFQNTEKRKNLDQ